MDTHADLGANHKFGFCFFITHTNLKQSNALWFVWKECWISFRLSPFNMIIGYDRTGRSSLAKLAPASYLSRSMHTTCSGKTAVGTPEAWQLKGTGYRYQVTGRRHRRSMNHHVTPWAVAMSCGSRHALPSFRTPDATLTVH